MEKIKVTYTATDIAKYIITYCHTKNQPISNLKLQKMLYYAWIDYYKATKTELYLDDICAWNLGPVVPNVYYEFCSYAGTPIPHDYQIHIIDAEKKVINPILEKYVNIAASTLVNRTHEKDMPWNVIFQDGLGNRDIIPFSLIIEKECQK